MKGKKEESYNKKKRKRETEKTITKGNFSFLNFDLRH